MPSTQYPDRIDYSGGGFAVSVSRDGSIKVKPGDSLSKYSMAIYGDFRHMDHFVRSNDMGYHFMITHSGTIYEGRRVNYKGAHVGVANTGKLGILVDGCFEPGANCFGTVVPPSQAQFNSLDKLLRALKGFLKTPSILGGHLDYMQTACPGQLLYDELPDIRLKHGFQRPACSSHPF